MTPRAFLTHFGGVTFAVVLGIAFLTGLGTWQLKRLSWKEALIETMQTRSTVPRVSLEDFLQDDQKVIEKEYRRLFLEGWFLHDQEAHLLGRTHSGQVVYHIMTPLLLESGSIILVDRGWVPAIISAKDPNIQRPEGVVKVDAYIKTKTSQNFFTPQNNYEKKELYFVDPVEFAQRKSLPTLLPFYVVQEGNSNTFPRPQTSVVKKIRNNHLEYAITWYSLAFILIIFYVLFLRQRYHHPPPSRKVD